MIPTLLALPSKHHRAKRGFTLAELLITLMILGEIATFTIPKVLQAQQNQQNNAIAKEVAGMLIGAYTAYSVQNTPSSSTSMGALTPYMNYVSTDAATVVDDIPTWTTINCATVAQRLCYRLHNGAIIWYRTGVSFGGTATTNAMLLGIDPDGKQSSTDAIVFVLYFNGRLSTYGQRVANTSDSIGNYGSPAANDDPTWFSW